MQKILVGTDLGRRVTFEGEEGIVRVHAAAIVRHPHQTASAGNELDLDAAGIGVETVLHQLLDH